MKEIIRKFPRVAPCLLAIIVDYAGFGVVYPIVAALFNAKGGIFEHVWAHNFMQGLAYLLYPLFMFFGAPIMGDLSDKYGRKRILEAALLGIAVSYCLMGVGLLFASLAFFLVGRALSGLFAGSQPLAQAIVADVSTHEDKKWNMGLISLTNDLGIVLGPLVAGVFTLPFFLKHGGYFYPFFFVAVVAVATYIWLLNAFQESYTSRPEKKIGIFRPILIFVDAFFHKSIRFMLVILLLFQLSMAIYFQMLAIYLTTKYHFSSSELGFFYGYFGIFMAIGVLAIYPTFIRRTKVSTVVIAGFLGQGIAMFCVGAIPNLFSIFVFSALFALFNVFAWTGFLSYYSYHVDKDHQGWAMGVFTSCVAIAFALAGLLTNILPWVSLQAQLAIGGILALIAAALFLLFDQTTGKHTVKS